MITCKASSTFKLTSHHPLHSIPRFLYPEPRIFLHFSSSSTRSSPPAPRSHGALVNGNGTRRITSIAEDDCDDEEEDDSAEKVRYQVDVVSWRERRLKADISVNADVDSVWDALTDYERLADFVPSLVSSRRIPCPHPGRIWLEQRGLQQALYWHIEARVVLDLQECVYSVDDRELRFSMVDGDFKKFEGKWSVKSGERSMVSILSYEVNVIPRFDVPAILLERIIRSDLPKNLQALACMSERNYEGIQKLLITEGSLGISSLAAHDLNGKDRDGSSIGKEKMIHREFKENNGSYNFGPLLPSSGESNSKWGAFGKVCGLDKPSMVDEVHLRRFDGLLENGGVHRCVVASITIKAPVREVWTLLTAYEKLPEIVPNLAISKILSRENNRVRILQEGCKGLLYMVLHARVILDLHEHLEQEITFEQVEGDFDSLQGKWLLEQLGSHHTLLKYTVESKMHKDTFLSEAIMEEVVYEDLPSNLCAIRDYIEKKEAVNSLEYSEETVVSSSSESDDDDSKEAIEVSIQNSLKSSRQRPRVPGLQRNIEVLKTELLKFVSEHGQEGFMPMRKQLRLHGRVDIEKAINRNGGFRKIASMMNLSLAYKYRKPKGYWDNIGNLKEEISRFQQHWGMDLSLMPSRKTFERAGRYDIARALEKWGGLHEVSQLLSLKTRHPNKNANLVRDKKVEQNTPSKVYVPQDTPKWLSTLKPYLFLPLRICHRYIWSSGCHRLLPEIIYLIVGNYIQHIVKFVMIMKFVISRYR